MHKHWNVYARRALVGSVVTGAAVLCAYQEWLAGVVVIVGFIGGFVVRDLLSLAAWAP